MFFPWTFYPTQGFEVQGLVKFDAQVLVGFHAQGLVGFGKFSSPEVGSDLLPYTSKVKLGETMNIIGITFKNKCEEFRRRNGSQTATSPKPTPVWVTVYKSCKHIAQSEGSSTSCNFPNDQLVKPLPAWLLFVFLRISASLCFF